MMPRENMSTDHGSNICFATSPLSEDLKIKMRVDKFASTLLAHSENG